jgi:hypothetical protein
LWNLNRWRESRMDLRMNWGTCDPWSCHALDNTYTYDILGGCAGAGADGANTGAFGLNDGLKTGAETDGTNNGAAALSTGFCGCNAAHVSLLVTGPTESVLISLAVSSSIPSSASLWLITNTSSSSATAACPPVQTVLRDLPARMTTGTRPAPHTASRSTHQAATVAPFAQK